MEGELKESIDSYKLVQGIKIKCQRPLGSRGIDVGFEIEAETRVCDDDLKLKKCPACTENHTVSENGGSPANLPFVFLLS